MDSVQPEPIRVVIPQPHEGIVDDEGPDLVASGAVIIDRPTPRRGIFISEVGAIGLQVIAVGTQVVVYDVDDHSEAFAMTGVDKALQTNGTSVSVVRRKEGHAVIT